MKRNNDGSRSRTRATQTQTPKRCTRCHGTGSIAICSEVIRCPKCQGSGHQKSA